MKNVKKLKITKGLLSFALCNTLLLTVTPITCKAVEMPNEERETKYVDTGYINSDCVMYDSIDMVKEVTKLPRLEFVEIYSILENTYLVKANNTYGYVSKNSVDLLNDHYIIVDISDQEVNMYNDNELLLTSPVVTGKPPYSSTPTGIYNIGDKQRDVTGARYLVGKGYKVHVDCMMKHDGNRGFHTADWRSAEEFGGTTYLTNGSHGCVNMPHEAAMDMYNVVNPIVNEQGGKVKVIVKE